MHIAMVTETYPPEVNGVANMVARAVEGLRRRGHTIQLARPRQSENDRAASEPGYAELLLPGVPIPRYRSLKMGLPSKTALARAWLNDRPDVVHVFTEGPLGWSALSAAWERAVPVATSFHTNFRAYSAHYGVGWLGSLVTAYLRRFHNRAHCTMVPTHELASELGAQGFERLRVVGRGVDSDLFSPAKRSPMLRAQWGADPDTAVVLCVSRFAPEKNLPLVIAAYRAMVDARPGTKLALIGDTGPLAREMRAAGACRVIAERLPRLALAEHYASADIFLFPSVTETFGNVTLEAMASGLAVVACDRAAARQHIRHRESGLLASADSHRAFIDHAVALACDLSLARSLGKAARHMACGIGWDTIVGEFEHVLLETAPVAVLGRQAKHAAA